MWRDEKRARNADGKANESEWLQKRESCGKFSYFHTNFFSCFFFLYVFFPYRTSQSFCVFKIKELREQKQQWNQ